MSYCPTPCKKGGELSGRGRCPGEHVQGDMSRGKCPDSLPHSANGVSYVSFSPAYNIWSSGLFTSRSDVLELTAQKIA